MRFAVKNHFVRLSEIDPNITSERPPSPPHPTPPHPGSRSRPPRQGGKVAAPAFTADDDDFVAEHGHSMSSSQPVARPSRPTHQVERYKASSQ